MSALAKAITRATRRRPDRYDLRLDFEHEIYSVAHHDRDSLDLNFLSGKFLAEQDDGAGAFTLADLVTWTRTDSAYYRDPADGLLKLASADVPRIHSLPPRIVGMAVDDDFSGYADEAEASAAGYHSYTSETTFDAAGNKWDFDGTNVAQIRLDRDFTGLPASAPGRFVVEFANVSGGEVYVQVGNSSVTAGSPITSDGAAVSLPSTVGTDGTLEVSVKVEPGVSCSVTRIAFQQFSHLDGERVGVLVEPESENKAFPSEDMATLATSLQYATWGTPKTALGNVTLDELVESTDFGKHYASFDFTGLASTDFTLKAFLEQNGRGVVRFLFTDGNVANRVSVFVDLRTGESLVTNLNGAGVSNGTRVFVNGETIEVYVAASVGATSFDVRVDVLQGSIEAPVFDYTGDGASGIYMGGVSCCDGTDLCQYIPTTTTPVARSADAGNVPLADFALDAFRVWPNKFTIAADATPLGEGGSCYFGSLGVANGRGFQLWGNTLGDLYIRLYAPDGSATLRIQDALAEGERVGVAGSAGDNSIRGAYNGGNYDAYGGSKREPYGIGYLHIGADRNGTVYRPVLIHSLRAYPREFGSTELEQESAL